MGIDLVTENQFISNEDFEDICISGFSNNKFSPDDGTRLVGTSGTY